MQQIHKYMYLYRHGGEENIYLGVECQILATVEGMM